MILLLFQYNTYSSQCGNWLSWERLVPECHLLPHIAQTMLQLWDQAEVDLLVSSQTNQFQHHSTLENPLPLDTLELNTFNHSWTYQVSYIFTSPVLVPLVLSRFLAVHVRGLFKFLVLVIPCWTEASYFPTVLSIMEDTPHQCYIIITFPWMFQ